MFLLLQVADKTDGVSVFATSMTIDGNKRFRGYIVPRILLSPL